MLFKNTFHAGIRDGSIRLTFRTWKSPRVTPGREYRFGARGVIEVEHVERVTVASIRPAESRKAGFPDVESLLAALRKTAPRLSARSAVFRFGFRFVGDRKDPRESLRSDASAAALDEVAVRLARLDGASRRGPWTRKVLMLIARHPQTASSKLAPKLDRELRLFKTDVRKLKALGLTRSLSVGYELAPRGEAYLARLGRAR